MTKVINWYFDLESFVIQLKSLTFWGKVDFSEKRLKIINATEPNNVLKIKFIIFNEVNATEPFSGDDI